MIKVALKHWIYEACISVLFDGVFKNFMKSKGIYDMLHKGEHIQRLELIYSASYIKADTVCYIYENVIITGISKPRKWVKLLCGQRCRFYFKRESSPTPTEAMYNNPGDTRMIDLSTIIDYKIIR